MEQEYKRHYYTDAMANYLILRCPASSLDGYQYRMLAANRIKGLLPCSMRCIDGESYLYYEITSRQSLARIYEHGLISGRELQEILYAVTEIFRALSDYLLDHTSLFMDPEFIFYDYETEGYYFTYYPEQVNEKGIQELLEYLADKTDPKSSDAAAAIYHLCDMAAHPGFVLREELLEHEFDQCRINAAGFESKRDPEKPEGLPPEKNPDLRADTDRSGQEKEDFNEEDDLLFQEDTSPEEDGADAAKKKRKKKPASGKPSKGKRKLSAGKILILSIMFLTAAVGLELASLFIPLTEDVLTAARIGAIAGLLLCAASAIYGMSFLYRKNRKEEEEKRRKEELRRRTRMVPSEEYLSEN